MKLAVVDGGRLAVVGGMARRMLERAGHPARLTPDAEIWVDREALP